MWCGFDWNIFQIITEIFTQFIQLCCVADVVDGAKFVVILFPFFKDWIERDYIELVCFYSNFEQDLIGGFYWLKILCTSYCRVRYGKYFTSFSYFATYFVSKIFDITTVR